MFKIIVLLVAATLSFAVEENKDSILPINQDENIKVLDLSNQGLKSLNQYSFSRYRQLEDLDLSNNDLEHIKEDTFISNVNLKRLNLSGNKRLELPEYSTLLIISNINELNLSNCNIEELPSNIFDGLVNLKTIDLSGNPLVEDAISSSTILSLLHPEKIILPHVHETQIKEICDNLDIVLEVASETIHCKDVRDGSWVYTSKEDVVENTENLIDDEKENKKRQTDINAKTFSLEEATTNENDVETTTDEMVTESNEEQSTLMESTEEQSTITEGTTITESTEEPSTTSNTNEPPPEVPKLEPRDFEITTTETPEENSASTTDAESISSADTREFIATTLRIDNLPIEIPADVVDGATAEAKNETLDENVTLEYQQVAEEPPIGVLQRGVLNAPPPPPPEHKSSEDKKAAQTTQEDVKMGESVGSSSTGTNVLIFLVVAVVVSGIAAFAFKFYKSRKYQAARTAEPIERELKEITVDSRMNGSNKPNVIEEEPLMHGKRENSVEITEVDEVNQLPQRETQDAANGATESGQYVPINTPFKVPNENKNS